METSETSETSLTGKRLLGYLNGLEIRSENMPEQPKQCVGCVYGRWDGLKQFCMFTRCVRNDDGF